MKQHPQESPHTQTASGSFKGTAGLEVFEKFGSSSEAIVLIRYAILFSSPQETFSPAAAQAGAVAASAEWFAVVAADVLAVVAPAELRYFEVGVPTVQRAEARVPALEVAAAQLGQVLSVESMDG